MPILLSCKSLRSADLGSGSVVNTSAFLWPHIPAYSAPHSNTVSHFAQAKRIFEDWHTLYITYSIHKGIHETCHVPSPAKPSHPPLCKFPEEFCIQIENNPDKSISCIPLLGPTGSQSSQYSMGDLFGARNGGFRPSERGDPQLPYFKKFLKYFTYKFFNSLRSLLSWTFKPCFIVEGYVSTLKTILKAPQNIWKQIFSSLSGLVELH